MARRGKFITLEGGEGAGKSTQASLLVSRLRGAGIAAEQTREPGGTPFAEAIRGVLVGKAARGVDPIAEALAHFAARADHIAKVIRPALEAGRWVVSDRFADSTYAYQAVAGGITAERFQAIQRAAIGDFVPDLTLVLDLPVEQGLARAADANRYERLGPDYHQQVRLAFRSLPMTFAGRCFEIDATGDVATIAQRIFSIVRDRLGVSL